MHYDNAVKLVVELDKVYNPFAIYPDRGAGEFSPLLKAILVVN